MKSFNQFLSEVTSTAGQQASRLGLVGDGHGGWYDKAGEFVAKTEKGKLKFYNKRQKMGQQDPPQSEKEKRLSHTTTASAPQTEPKGAASQQAAQPQAQEPVAQQDDPEGPVEPEDLTPQPVKKTRGTLTIAFGRFNPPTTGHEKLLDTVASSSDDGDYVIVPSRSQDKKKNPLDADQKVGVMRAMFPNHSEKIVNDPANRTIFDVLKKAHNDGYTNVRLVVGSDRQKEFDKLTNNYNGLQYDFEKVEVRSAGDRDPDGDGVEGMSASKQRKYAADNDFDNFIKGVPTAMNKKMAKDLFNNIRAGMNIKEGWNMWEIAPRFDWKNLRENYIKENIYKVGQFVENLNTGFIGKIIRRGTNYLICVTEDKIMFKSWIQDVTESIVNGTTQSGVPANQREIGTDAHRKYVEKLTPGSEWGKHFINKYRKK
jgi:nicotinic acid mononucleotide adenylyltransferase